MTPMSQARFAARGVLARHETEPGGELPAAAEIARVSYGGHDRHGGERANAADLHQALGRFALPRLLFELPVIGADARIELRQVCAQIRDRLAREHGQRFRRGQRTATHPLRAVGQHHAEFGQDRAQPVDCRRALLDVALAHSMQSQQRLLLGTLDRHQTHIGPAHRLADRLGVVAVVLAAFAVRRNEHRRHQPHRVPQRLKPPCPFV